MPIVERRGNIFTTDLPAIAHGVNTRGRMGAGIALQVARLYPSVFAEYKKQCKSPGMRGGDHLPVKSRELGDERWILNVASQQNLGPDARMEWLEAGVEKALAWAHENDIRGIAFPQIGCGIGALDWPEVSEAIIEIASKYPDLIIELWEFSK